MKKTISLLVVVVLVLSVAVGCAPKETEASDSAQESFQYYTAEETKAAIENEEDIILLDIQVEEEWTAHHIKGAIATHAYPVKTDEEKAKVEAVLDQLEGDQPIIVVCPGGKGGAQRTISYLKTKDIAADRLFILENGQGGWPYDELLEK